MEPTHDLVHEHEVILRAAAVMERMAYRLDAGSDVSGIDLERLVRFLEGFLHGCHHRKEEQALFPLMAKRSPQIEAGPVKVLRGEHGAGAVFMQKLRDAGAAHDYAGLAKTLNAYAALLRRHISKENEIFFPLATALLTEDEKRAIVQQFEAVERELDEHRLHREMEETVVELEKTYGIAA